MRHYNIPVFIPERACPFQCIYCNQQKITGSMGEAEEESIIEEIETHLATIPQDGSEVQIAFFGGTFTGMSHQEQENYLSLIQPYIETKQVGGIRISTHPDYIDQENLDLLKAYHVTHIELGAQSLVDKVLKQSHRGHTYAAVEKASGLIKENGFVLGLQMMLGLPGDTADYAEVTARKIIALGAQETRIYPTLVIKGTSLEVMLRKGIYQVMTTEEAVRQSAQLYTLFKENNVKVLRVGLYPSEDLLVNEVVGGPDMRHFKEKVMTHLWADQLAQLSFDSAQKSSLEILVAPDQLNFAIGFQGVNRKRLLQEFKKVKFKGESNLSDFQFDVNCS